MKWIYRFCHFGSGWLVRLFYGNRVYGIEHLPAGSAIIAPNHASHLDPPLVASAVPMEIHFLARETLFRPPFLGWLLPRLNTHPVNGSGSDITSLRLIMQLLQEGKKVMIFPEGTRTPNGEFGECSLGVGMIALRSGAPVVPVYVHGTYEAWSRHRKYPKLRGRTACVIGEPFSAAQFEGMGRKEAQGAVAQEVMRRIGELKRWYETTILLKNKK